jgi:hypothetical protein
MTKRIDAPIPFDRRTPEAVNSALIYMAYVAWPHARQEKERDRFVLAHLAALHKSARKHLPPALPRIKRENISATVNRGLARISTRRVPALRMLLQRWLRMKFIDGIPGLTRDQMARMRELSAAHALVDPAGDITGEGRSYVSEDREIDNIKKDIWRDSLPALAMLLGPQHLRRAGQRWSATSLLYDASWVPEAVAYAQMFASVIEHTVAPPTLLVPKVRFIRPATTSELSVPSTKLKHLLSGPR